MVDGGGQLHFFPQKCTFSHCIRKYRANQTTPQSFAMKSTTYQQVSMDFFKQNFII